MAATGRNTETRRAGYLTGAEADAVCCASGFFAALPRSLAWALGSNGVSMHGIALAGATFLFIVTAASCHRNQIIQIPDCGPQPLGAASVDFAAAIAPSERYRGTALGGLVVYVVEGTLARPALSDANVIILGAGQAADSGQRLTSRATAAGGVIVADSLSPRRYEVVVRRIGYGQVRQRITVRSTFVDTLVVALRGEAFCLVE